MAEVPIGMRSCSASNSSFTHPCTSARWRYRFPQGRLCLADDVLVGEADDETVLGRIVLVLGLGNQPLARIVVGYALLETATSWIP